MVSSPFRPLGWEWGSGGAGHPSTLQFVVILWSNLYCLCFCERIKEGSVWIVKLCLYYNFILFYFCNLLWINDKGKRGRYVTLYRWPAKQTIPLSVLARNQTKGFWTWNLTVSGSGKGTRKGVGWRKELTGSWRGTTDRCGRLRRQ